MQPSLLLMLCLLSQILFAQYKADTSLKNYKIQESQHEPATVKKMLIDYHSENPATVGELIMKQNANIDIFIFSSKAFTPTGHKVDIDSIMGTVRNGYIVDITVFANSGDEKKTFINARAPIGITSGRFKSSDLLLYSNKNVNEYIYVSQFLMYKSLKQYNPADDDFNLTSSSSGHSFMKGIGLNTVFDLRLATDVLGVFGDEPNGLIQAEGHLKQVFHNINLLKTGAFLFNTFKFDLNLSKFDSRSAYTEYNSFSRSAMFQRSWLNASLAFSVINGWLSNKSLSSYYFDVGAGLSLSKLARQKDTISVTAPNFFIEPGLDFKIADNIGSILSTKMIWQYSPQTDFNGQDDVRLFIRPAFTIFWNPSWQKESRIFGSCMYTMDSKDERNSFFQVQVGYSLFLTSLIR